jgi:hypothetical protein
VLNVKGAVKIHKKHTFDLIRGSEQEITVRLPVAKTSSGVNPLFGDFARETDYTGDEEGPFKCIWHDALSARAVGPGTGLEPTRQLVVGQYKNATAYAELWLDDVLVDPSLKTGKTWFDISKVVVYEDKFFTVLGEIRTGLATAAPYICIIVLKGGSGYDEQ